MSLLRVKNNEQLDEEERLTQEAELEKPPELSGLSVHIRAQFQKMRTAKTDVTSQMLTNHRSYNGWYEPDQLAAMQLLYGEDYDPVYMRLTTAKVNAALAFLRETYNQPKPAKPFGIEPTPLPELPPDIEQAINQRALESIFKNVMEESITMTGKAPAFQEMQARIDSMIPQLKARIDLERQRQASLLAEKQERKINDKLVEGGWYQALDDSLFDIVCRKGGIIKGPVYVTKTKRKRNFNFIAGRWETIAEKNIIPTWERANPHDMYFLADAINHQDGDLIHHIRFRAGDLHELRDVPGWSTIAIDKVLALYQKGGLREWVEQDTEIARVEGRDSSELSASEKISCLEFWGTVSGEDLLQWQIDFLGEAEGNVIPTGQYNITAYLIGSDVIKATINENPEGIKPFWMAGFQKCADSPWYEGIPELINDCQRVCNACARAIVNNVGIGSGPQIEVDDERNLSGDSVYPLKVWKSTNQQMLTGPAVRFTQPPIIVEKLILCYDKFSAIADEHCGIPSFTHGNPQQGGVGRTASGMSMFVTASNRGINYGVVHNIDNHMIKPSVEYLYYDLLESDDDGSIPDMNIVAKGVSSVMAKEQQLVRKTDFLASTANPLDVQILGPDVRRRLLIDVAKSLNIDLGRLTEELELEGIVVPPQPAEPMAPAIEGSAPPPAQRNVDTTGAIASGQDNRVFRQGEVTQ